MPTTPTIDLGASRPARQRAKWYRPEEKVVMVVEALRAAGRPLNYVDLAERIGVPADTVRCVWRPVVVRPGGPIAIREYRSADSRAWRTHLLLAEWLETGETETETEKTEGGAR